MSIIFADLSNRVASISFWHWTD